MIHDTPIAGVTDLVRILANQTHDKVDILIVTARHEPYRTHTENWLAKFNIPYTKLYMRADGDYRQDHEVKIDILSKILDDGFDPFLVIDDRPEVVEAWRNYGLTVLQCNYEDVSTKYTGKVMLTLLVGPAGAGKSTFAENYKSGVISTDKIRQQENLGHSPDDLSLTFKLARGYAKARIAAGLPAIIDATNLKKKDRMAFNRLVPKGGLIEYVVICRDYDHMIANRGWRPVELIDKHYRTFMKELPDILKGDHLPNVIVKDCRKK
jgi:predicted kinase